LNQTGLEEGGDPKAMRKCLLHPRFDGKYYIYIIIQLFGFVQNALMLFAINAKTQFTAIIIKKVSSSNIQNL
jgi:hypothetical protein